MAVSPLYAESVFNLNFFNSTYKAKWLHPISSTIKISLQSHFYFSIVVILSNSNSVEQFSIWFDTLNFTLVYAPYSEEISNF